MLAFSLYISVTQTQAVTLASHILSRLWCYSSTSMIGTWSPLYCEEISLDFIWYQKFLAFQLLSYKPPEWLAASHSYGNLPHVRSCTCRVLILHYCQALRFPLSRTPQQLPFGYSATITTARQRLSWLLLAQLGTALQTSASKTAAWPTAPHSSQKICKGFTCQQQPILIFQRRQTKVNSPEMHKKLPELELLVRQGKG